MDLLLAERLLLVALDPRTGKVRSSPSSALPLALAGSLVMDLLLRGGAQLQPPARVVPVRPVGDPLLDQTLSRIGAGRRPRSMTHWVRALGDPRRLLLRRLVERGVLAERPHRVLGLFPTRRHALIQPAALAETVAPLQTVLIGQSPTVTPGVAALASLISVTGLEARVVPPEYLRDARRRAKSIARGDLGSQAVSAVLRDAQAAMNAALLANLSATAINH